MGMFDDLVTKTNSIIDEMDSSSEKSRTQSFLDLFWKTRDDIDEAKFVANGKDKDVLSKLSKLFERKGKENDMEPF